VVLPPFELLVVAENVPLPPPELEPPACPPAIVSASTVPSWSRSPMKTLPVLTAVEGACAVKLSETFVVLVLLDTYIRLLVPAAPMLPVVEVNETMGLSIAVVALVPLVAATMLPTVVKLKLLPAVRGAELFARVNVPAVVLVMKTKPSASVPLAGAFAERVTSPAAPLLMNMGSELLPILPKVAPVLRLIAPADSVPPRLSVMLPVRSVPPSVVSMVMVEIEPLDAFTLP